MSKIIRPALFFLFSLFVVFQARAFNLPNATLDVGSPVFIENFDEENYYAVFLPFEEPTNGDVCANMSGGELVADNNLKNYGTCFINDPGVFTIVEMEQPFSSSYSSLLENEEILQEEKITMISLETGESNEGVVTDLDKFIENAESEIERILENLIGTDESTESTSSESVLGIGTVNLISLIRENILLISITILLLITLILLIFVIGKKWDKPKEKR